MPQASIDSVAEEPDARKVHRNLLQSKLDVLNRSSLLCKLYMENDCALRMQDMAALHMGQMSSNDRTPTLEDGTPEEEVSTLDAYVEASQEVQEVLFTPDVPDEVPAELVEPTAELPEDAWGMSFATKKDKKKKKKSTYCGPDVSFESWGDHQ